MIHRLCTKSNRESKNLSWVWPWVALVPIITSGALSTYSNSCNWRVDTKLYISPWLPHCRLFATLISWSWSAYHWHHNQYLCNWHINHSRSPSKHVCTNHQHWSASWLVGTLISFVFRLLAKASSQFRETGIVHNSGMCTSPPASLPLGGQSGLGVYRGQSGCTENYSTNTFSTGFLPQLYKVGWLSKRVESFLL